ncbi:glycoside hydrolase family 36 protein [Trichoderma atroviride IMI 206040]|uniref:Glycoside hydrolase family 36 protein n=2 Tax=Hypocrea atroviridis TaxID=63577 RepID=G9P9U8_HYPAI|nr:glycoside hydrolase family 36 protein [Trichoderma atroviride IMI 206040]EHK40420.1 glycoside hydrolase family 36 protein [Trichoderma atroviride IMI 206040]
MAPETYDFANDFKTLYIPKQKPEPASVPENMKAILQSYPPLSQVTSVESSSSVPFTALLEIPKSRAEESWEVALWHSIDGEDWTEAEVPRIKSSETPQALHAESEAVFREYYATKVSFKKSLRFTIKFRHNHDEPWRWIRDEQGLQDGHIVLLPAPTESDNLADLIPGLDNAWKVASRMSQAPKTQLWSLEAVVPPAENDLSSFTDIQIGTPWGSFLRWFAVVRLWSPWLAPRHGRDHFSLDKDAILLAFQSPEGRNLVLLAVSGINDSVPVFQNTSSGAVSVNVRNDSASDEKVIILVSEGNDFQRAVAAVMYHARTLVMKARSANQAVEEELKTLSDAVRPEWLENWYDGLGFCTWNALGQRLTEQKIVDAIDKLEKHNINVTSLIIDDNWQSIDYKGPSQFQYGWVDFEAEPEAFPNGLKSTISKIRQKSPNIQHIAVWHALLGYWGGISPDGKLAKKYKTIEVVREEAKRRNLPLGGKMTVVDKDDVRQFYDDFYQFLSDAGVDGVKTDAQFMIDMWLSASVRRELINTYLDAWNLTSLRYFSVKAMSCMSQIPQALFNSQMIPNRPALLVRNSDDFFPQIPSSHPWHVWTNAYNSIFMEYLNVLPDWDMFQTVHDYSGFHAAARCVSGGPIYITDVPGEHNLDLIGQMTGLTPKGKTVIFRPSVLGKAIYPYIGYDDDLLLKVGSYHGASETGTPMVAIFNISARPLTELIPLSCFPGTVPSLHYIVRAHATEKASAPMKLDDPTSLIVGSLEVRGYEIFTAFQAVPLTGPKYGDIWVANMGLINKMTGSVAIIASSISLKENGRVSVAVKLKALGVFGVYISTLPKMTLQKDFIVTLQDQAVPVETVGVSQSDQHVLEINIERAWKDMELEPGRLDEVEIKVSFAG